MRHDYHPRARARARHDDRSIAYLRRRRGKKHLQRCCAMLCAKSLFLFLLSLSLSLSFPLLLLPTRTFCSRGLSYGARKHTQIRTQLPPGQREVISSVYFTSGALGAADLEYRVKSLLRQLRIRISPAPGRRSGKRGGFSARCVRPGCYISPSPESDFHHGGAYGLPAHFNGYFLRNRAKVGALRTKEIAEAGI